MSARSPAMIWLGNCAGWALTWTMAAVFAIGTLLCSLLGGFAALCLFLAFRLQRIFYGMRPSRGSNR